MLPSKLLQINHDVVKWCLKNWPAKLLYNGLYSYSQTNGVKAQQKCSYIKYYKNI